MFSFFKRAFLIVIGFLLIAVFIWTAGPYLGFGAYRPLEPPLARLIAIGIVVAYWIGSRLLRRLRSYRASDRLLAAVVAQPKHEPSRPSAEAAKLRERFEEAVATLKQQRRTGHSLYDLPWYVIIGAPGSGKTTALLNSGLKLPLEQRVGKGALRGIGGTRNCDWWFTDEAVFLDTAGRYTTQDSDAASDAEGWGEFLALLRKYRARRPVNGVILTINAEDLMAQGHTARETHVEAARRRLNELNRELRIQLPVYLIVTKCDMVAGFTEYFDDLAHEGRAQVWGVTFPYQQTLSGEATDLFPAEFDALMSRLNARVFARLEEVREVRRRTRIFAFPQQMAALGEPLAQFVSDVFSSTRYDQQILLRGVYFTSGTQHGMPIDRLMAGIGRRFGMAPDALAQTAAAGKAYFVERLLKDVLIGESGLAGVNRRVEARKAAAQLASYAAIALVTTAGVVALTVSYSRNRAYLAQTATDVAALRRLPPAAASASLEQLLPRLDGIRAVVDSADRYREGSPWTMRWGLYQGGSVGNSARDAYLRELDGMLLPRVAVRIGNRLVEYGREPEKLYVYLKAYLMLGEPAHLDKRHLESLVDLEWKSPGAGATGVGPALSKHFQSLLASDDTLRPIAIDRTLVARVRSSIRQVSLPQILYGRIKRTYADDRARALRLDQLAGQGVEQVFRRRSGVDLSEPIPSLYGRVVFEEITGKGTAELLEELEKDNWVWGEGSVPAADPATIALDVSNLYELDYISAWDAVLNDLEFVSFETVQQTSDALRILTASTSPLRGLLRVVRDNTALVVQPKADETGALAGIRKKLDERVLKPFREATGSSTAAPGAMIAAHFQPIQLLMAGEPGKAPIDGILSVIGEIQRHLSTLGSDVAGVDPVKILSSPALRAVMLSFEQQAEALPPGLRTLVKQIQVGIGESLTSVATDEIEERYQSQVLTPCRELVENRYPFASDSAIDVTLADFGRVFGYGGVFDKFFTDNLAGQVDTSRRPWTSRPGAARPSERLLQRLEAAQDIRQMFFADGAQTPGLAFWVTLANLDAKADRFILQVDGQNRDVTPKGPSKTRLEWPGTASGQVVATFESRYLPDRAMTYPGAWGWFRMIDATAKTPDSRLRVTLDVRSEYHQVQAMIEAASARNNPFALREWRQFSCEA